MSEFAINLRTLRKESNMRQSDLADKLGVAQTTIASYEQDKRFPNHETLIEIADLFNVSIDFLLGRVKSSKYDINDVKEEISKKYELKDTAQKYLNKLLTGDNSNADELLYQALDNGKSLQYIYLNILQPVLVEIGKLWETNQIEVFQEHFMTNHIYTVLDKLKDRTTKKKNEKYAHKNILLISVSGEQHQIGLRMINNLLEINGFKTFYLGTNLPNRSVLKAIKNYEADLLLISVTLIEHLNQARNLIQSIRNNKSARDIDIIVGGAAFQRFKWEDIGADGYGIDAGEAIEKIKEIINK